MKHHFSQALRALAFTTALLSGACAFAADETPKPATAGDVGGNGKGFFGNLGKGVTIRKPYEEYAVVSRGIVPGKGPGYCLMGESLPHLESAPSTVNLALVPCKTLEDAGQFQRVANAATPASSPGQAGRTGDAASIDPSKQCTYFHKPVGDGTGDQWCMMRDGMVIGRVHYEMNKQTGNYEPTLTRLEKPVSIGILAAGGSVDSKGNVKLPDNVQAGWDKVDRMKDEGAARVKAESEATQAANADKSVMRKAAMEKCKPLIKGDDAKMTAFKACFKDATQ